MTDESDTTTRRAEVSVAGPSTERAAAPPLLGLGPQGGSLGLELRGVRGGGDHRGRGVPDCPGYQPVRRNEEQNGENDRDSKLRKRQTRQRPASEMKDEGVEASYQRGAGCNPAAWVPQLTGCLVRVPA
jgi:hypothetical protein